MIQLAQLDYSLVIWPDNISAKDINDMVLTSLPVYDIIKENTYRGLEAQMRVAAWKK